MALKIFLSEGYDPKLALYTEDLLNWIKTTQPEPYEKFAKRPIRGGMTLTPLGDRPKEP